MHEWLAQIGQGGRVRIVTAPGPGIYSAYIRDSVVRLTTPDRHLIFIGSAGFGMHGHIGEADFNSPFSMALLAGAQAHISDLYLQGGDVLAGRRPDGTLDTFVSTQLAEENAVRGGLDVPKIVQRTRNLFGQTPVPLQQAQTHLDLILLFAPGGHVAVAIPHMAVDALKGMTDEQKKTYMRGVIAKVAKYNPKAAATMTDNLLIESIKLAPTFQGTLDAIAQQLAALGYHVHRIPWLPDPTYRSLEEGTQASAFGKERAGFGIYYPNSFFESSTELLSPTYGLPTDAIADRVLAQEMGIPHVVQVPAESLAPGGAAFHCILFPGAMAEYPSDHPWDSSQTSFVPQDDHEIYLTDARESAYHRFASLISSLSVRGNVSEEQTLFHFLTHPEPEVRKSAIEFMDMQWQLQQKGRGGTALSRDWFTPDNKLWQQLAVMGTFDLDRDIRHQILNLFIHREGPERGVKDIEAAQDRWAYLRDSAPRYQQTYLHDHYGVNHPLRPPESALLRQEDGLQQYYSARLKGKQAADVITEDLTSSDADTRLRAVQYLVVSHFGRFGDLVVDPHGDPTTEPTWLEEDPKTISALSNIAARIGEHASDPSYLLARDLLGHLFNESDRARHLISTNIERVDNTGDAAGIQTLNMIMTLYPWYVQENTVAGTFVPVEEFPWVPVLLWGSLGLLGLGGFGFYILRGKRLRQFTAGTPQSSTQAASAPPAPITESRAERRARARSAAKAAKKADKRKGEDSSRLTWLELGMGLLLAASMHGHGHFMVGYLVAVVLHELGHGVGAWMKGYAALPRINRHGIEWWHRAAPGQWQRLEDATVQRAGPRVSRVGLFAVIGAAILGLSPMLWIPFGLATLIFSLADGTFARARTAVGGLSTLDTSITTKESSQHASDLIADILRGAFRFSRRGVFPLLVVPFAMGQQAGQPPQQTPPNIIKGSPLENLLRQLYDPDLRQAAGPQLLATAKINPELEKQLVIFVLREVERHQAAMERAQKESDGTAYAHENDLAQFFASFRDQLIAQSQDPGLMLTLYAEMRDYPQKSTSARAEALHLAGISFARSKPPEQVIYQNRDNLEAAMVNPITHNSAIEASKSGLPASAENIPHELFRLLTIAEHERDGSTADLVLDSILRIGRIKHVFETAPRYGVTSEAAMRRLLEIAPRMDRRPRADGRDELEDNLYTLEFDIATPALQETIVRLVNQVNLVDALVNVLLDDLLKDLTLASMLGQQAAVAEITSNLEIFLSIRPRASLLAKRVMREREPYFPIVLSLLGDAAYQLTRTDITAGFLASLLKARNRPRLAQDANRILKAIAPLIGSEPQDPALSQDIDVDNDIDLNDLTDEANALIAQVRASNPGELQAAKQADKSEQTQRKADDQLKRLFLKHEDPSQFYAELLRMAVTHPILLRRMMDMLEHPDVPLQRYIMDSTSDSERKILLQRLGILATVMTFRIQLPVVIMALDDLSDPQSRRTAVTVLASCNFGDWGLPKRLPREVMVRLLRELSRNEPVTPDWDHIRSMTRMALRMARKDFGASDFTALELAHEMQLNSFGINEALHEPVKNRDRGELSNEGFSAAQVLIETGVADNDPLVAQLAGQMDPEDAKDFRQIIQEKRQNQTIPDIGKDLVAYAFNRIRYDDDIFDILEKETDPAVRNPALMIAARTQNDPGRYLERRPELASVLLRDVYTASNKESAVAAATIIDRAFRGYSQDAKHLIQEELLRMRRESLMTADTAGTLVSLLEADFSDTLTLSVFQTIAALPAKVVADLTNASLPAFAKAVTNPEWIRRLGSLWDHIRISDAAVRRPIVELLLTEKVLKVAAGEIEAVQGLDGALSVLIVDIGVRATLAEIQNTFVDLPVADEAARWLIRSTAQLSPPAGLAAGLASRRDLIRRVFSSPRQRSHSQELDKAA